MYQQKLSVLHVATTIKPSTSHHAACVKWAKIQLT